MDAIILVGVVVIGTMLTTLRLISNWHKQGACPFCQPKTTGGKRK